MNNGAELAMKTATEERQFLALVPSRLLVRDVASSNHPQFSHDIQFACLACQTFLRAENVMQSMSLLGCRSRLMRRRLAKCVAASFRPASLGNGSLISTRNRDGPSTSG
jgi:hypothetical protein